MAEPTERFRRSIGLSVVGFLDGAYVYDAAADVFHRVGPAAAALLADDTETSVADVVDRAAADATADRAQVEAAVTAGIGALRDLGLLDRRDPYWAPTAAPGGSELAAHDGQGGVAFVVHDTEVTLRCANRALLADIETHLGFAAAAPAAAAEAVVFDVVVADDGRVVLHAAEEWDFPDRDQFFVQLPGVLNDYAMRSHSVAVLHAGAVLTPSGRVLVVCGDAESGKSTLIGALVQHGCGYLGDELIGIHPRTLDALPYPKPLELDDTSCAVLQVRPRHAPNVLATELRPDATLVRETVGPPAEVILPAFAAGAARDTDRLSVEDAAKVLLRQTMNMRRVRAAGLQAICELATRTPVTRIVHGDSVALAADLVAADGSAPTGQPLPTRGTE